MPIYEYTCQECERVFEALRPMGQADAPIPCAACGGTQTRRRLSLFYAESGGRAVAGTSGPSCGSCAGGDCAGCGR